MDVKEAEKKVDEIISDIEDRRGIGNEWEMIDDKIKREIRDLWIAIIVS
jgi:hypothetical protein